MSVPGGEPAGQLGLKRGFLPVLYSTRVVFLLSRAGEDGGPGATTAMPYRDSLRQPDNMTLPLPPATPVAFTTPRLKDRAAHGAARFVPEYSEVFASIFTWWNALDALMATTADIPWQTGYVREVQVRRMVALVQEAAQRSPSQPITYCEVGSNGGHSVVSMLLASPRVQAFAFDPLEYSYSGPMVKLLRASFGERFNLTKGYSAQTVPHFVKVMRAAERSCDVVLVDGDHGFVGTYRDLRMLQRASSSTTAVVVDDVVPQCGEMLGGIDEADATEYCARVRRDTKGRESGRIVRPGAALRRAQADGLLSVQERYGPFAMGTRYNPCFRTNKGPWCGGQHQFDWGFAVARYVLT